MPALIERIQKNLRHVKNLVKPNSHIDNRGRYFIAVIECILNQNVRDSGAARFPAINNKVVSLCKQYDVGLLQISCPEIAVLGWERSRPLGQSLREALETPEGRNCCVRIAKDTADRIQSHCLAGNNLLAVLGGNHLSPGCAVHNSDNCLKPESGVLMQELQLALRIRNINAPFRGIRDDEYLTLEADIEWLQTLLKTRF